MGEEGPFSGCDDNPGTETMLKKTQNIPAPRGSDIFADAGPERRNLYAREREGDGGFSLIELIITIIIASVLITIALPFSRNFIVNYRLNSAAGDIVAALQLAKMTAVRKNANTVAVFSSSPYSPQGQAGTYRIYVDSDADWVEDSGEETLVPTVTMPAGTTLYFSTFTNNGSGTTDRAGFSPSGLVARSTTGAFVSGEVRLRNVAGRYTRVQVSPAGGITLTKSQDGINWN